ncbi:MAG: GntR family transcriptional regulator [Hyphomicrobiaceae bacterium]
MSERSNPEPVDFAARVASLTEQAYVEIEERIVTLQLAPGELVTETALVDAVRLGRTPVREAVQRLAREGLVVISPRKGMRVSESDPAQQLLVLEVRRELEQLLARLAAVRSTSAERQAFRDIADGMDEAAKAADEIVFMRHDRALNILLSVAAHNEYAAGAMRLINGHSRRFWFQHHKARGDLPLCARLHADQARAVAEGDPALAAAATNRLIDYTVAYTTAVREASR